VRQGIIGIQLFDNKSQNSVCLSWCGGFIPALLVVADFPKKSTNETTFRIAFKHKIKQTRRIIHDW